MDIVTQHRQGDKSTNTGVLQQGEEQARGKTLQEKETKRPDTYPDLRYLATVLWTYIITTGLTTGLPKWITGGGGL